MSERGERVERYLGQAENVTTGEPRLLLSHTEVRLKIQTGTESVRKKDVYFVQPWLLVSEPWQFRTLVC
jgi:hypothetical protein